MEIRNELSQRLSLSYSLLQSINILQMSYRELQSYVNEKALENPLIDINSINSFHNENASDDYINLAIDEETFVEHLKNQLAQMKELDSKTLNLCLIIVDSLNSQGFLDIPIKELAKELNEKLFDLEQALFIVQSLEPIGSGARNLSECLLLQLANSHNFTELNLHMILNGLDYLAQNDIKRLCSLLNATKEEVKESAKIIRAMSPIPSSGFSSNEPIQFLEPDIFVSIENNNTLSIRLNDCILPHITIDSSYGNFIEDIKFDDARQYLIQKQNEVNELIDGIHKRSSTLLDIFSKLAEYQRNYFIYGSELFPISMQELADSLGINVSTVSRAIKDKTFEFNSKIVPIKDLISTKIKADNGFASSNYVKKKIKQFIDYENTTQPLSDGELANILCSIGINISRRTVAKYRNELGYSAAEIRKREKI